MVAEIQLTQVKVFCFVVANICDHRDIGYHRTDILPLEIVFSLVLKDISLNQMIKEAGLHASLPVFLVTVTPHLISVLHPILGRHPTIQTSAPFAVG